MTSNTSGLAARKQQLSPTSGAELVQRARELSKLLAARAHDAEKLRRPADDVIQALKDAEIFKLMTPRVYGGLECDIDTFFEVGIALGEGDASMSWVTTFYIEHVWIFCLFPKEFQEELFADKSFVLAPAMLSPTGQVTKEKGGYRLSGRWSWSTGIMHADWVLPAAIVTGEDGKRAPWFFALPRSEVKVEDTWFVDGMQATGSNDVIIDNVFVPEGRMLSFQQMIEGDTPGAKIHANPLYRTPMLPTLGLAAAMPALGQARACVRMYKERLLDRMANGGLRKVGAASQMRLARAEMQVEQTYLLLRNLVQEVMTVRDKATRLDRARWATQLAFAVDQCKATIAYVCEAAGATGHFQSSPLGRAARDINTVGAHIVFDLDARLELYGAAQLGVDIPGILV
jgi:3-hydroxy-9,10-secoandrosta-1,3,5(10)-triene-9,17-dione monooxygenase